MTSFTAPDLSNASDAWALAARIRRGELDPVEVVDAALARIDAVDGVLGAFVEVDAAGARRTAVAVHAALRAGDRLGPLAGVPVGVKDLFDVTGSHTRAGSAVPPDPPAVRDAVAVTRLREAGAIPIGRTRTHEFAWGITTQHAFLGGTRNPHAIDRIPGGSSGGSAAAVAAGMVPLALGTDTGCSLRLPAAFCGLVAHKPTHGLVPLDGVLPLSPSMDTGGALVRTVGDARFALELLSGRRLPDRQPVNGLRVGVAAGGGGEFGVQAGGCLPLDRSVAAAYGAAADALDGRVRSVVEIGLPLSDRVVDAYRGVQAREALQWHRETGRWPRYADRYGPDVRARLAAAEEMSATELNDAQALRSQLREEMGRVFDRVDLLLLPVASTGPSTVDEPDVVYYRTAEHDEGQHGDLRVAVLPWTVPANLGGWPACSVPVGRDSDGLPIGVQIVGPAGSDARVLDLAAELEASLLR